MPSYDENGNEIPEAPSEGSRLRNELEETRAENKRLAEEAEAGREAQAELAFTRANLPDSKSASYFRDHYDGDMTPDAIRAAAIDAGVVEEVTPAAQQAQAAQQQMAQAALGGLPTPPPGAEDEMWREFEKAVSNPHAMNPIHDGQEVLRRYGRAGEPLPHEFTQSGMTPQTVGINQPGYQGTPIQ